MGLAAQSIRATMIASQDQAQERGFVDSPTILVDGVDPFGVVGQDPALCLPSLGNPGGVVRCAAVGRRHHRTGCSPRSGARFARMSCSGVTCADLVGEVDTGRGVGGR